MLHRTLEYSVKRYGLGTDCALLSMPDCYSSYLMSFNNFLRHVTTQGEILLSPWAQGPVRDSIERIRDGNVDWSHEVTAFKVPTGVETFIISVFNEANVPKMRYGNDVFSCWPASQVRMALEDLGVAWEEPALSAEALGTALHDIGTKSEEIWPRALRIILQYDHKMAPRSKQKKLKEFEQIAREVLGWPVVQIDSGNDEKGDVWCHYHEDTRRAAWKKIEQLEPQCEQ